MSHEEQAFVKFEPTKLQDELEEDPLTTEPSNDGIAMAGPSTASNLDTTTEILINDVKCETVSTFTSILCLFFVYPLTFAIFYFIISIS